VLAAGLQVELRLPGGVQQREIVGVRRHKGFYLIRLAGIEDRTAAEALVGAELWIESGALPELPEGEYYYRELVGMQVVTMDGETVGTVTEVWPAPGADVLVVRRETREHLIPMVEAFVKEVHRERREIRIDPIPGLLSE
jgi:16S rRNA processing protein RimM